jgi:hypothetical protein
VSGMADSPIRMAERLGGGIRRRADGSGKVSAPYHVRSTAHS